MCIVSLYDVMVALDGSGDFHSIEDAVHHAPLNDECYVIYIRKGIYHERFEINRPHVYLIGEDRDQTIITASTANGMLDELGRKFATFGSRTLSINAPDFRARSLTIQNGFDFPANQMKSDEDPTKLKHTQAVALLVSHDGDRAQFKDVRLVSYHDTLYLYAGRSYFEKCQIMGTVDFIFGGGTAVIEQSEIMARDRHDVVDDKEPYGYLTAPCTPIEQPFGFIFKACRLTKEPEVPCRRYRLGRPWHPTTQFADGAYADPDAIGQAIFMHCDMDEHIAEWDKMGGRDRHQNTIWFYPDESRFFEYQNQGLGADVNHPHRPQLTAQQVKAYTPKAIFSGWQPDISLGETCVLRGEVLDPEISFPVTIVVTDCFGQSKMTQTDHHGQYRLSVQSLTPPLLAAVCLDEPASVSHPIRALIVKVYHHGETLGHLNAFTDQIVASVFAGEWVQKGGDGPFVPILSRRAWQQAYDHAQSVLNAIATEYRIDILAQINPISYGDESRQTVAWLVGKLHQHRLSDPSTVLYLE